MPSTTIYNQAGEALEQLELSEQVFGITPNMAVLHQVVTAQLVNRRQGNASTKRRGEVSGGNKKPYRQKGTGRARQGSTRAPQFRHGGVVFGPKPHPYHHDVPKKMRRLAIRSVLSDKVANDALIIVDSLSMSQPRTKDMIEILDNLPLGEDDRSRKVLMMLSERDENIVLSVRNVKDAKVQHVCSINVVELLQHKYVIMPVQAVRWIELVFGEGLSAEEASRRVSEAQAVEPMEEVTEEVQAQSGLETVMESTEFVPLSGLHEGEAQAVEPMEDGEQAQSRLQQSIGEDAQALESTEEVTEKERSLSEVKSEELETLEALVESEPVIEAEDSQGKVADSRETSTQAAEASITPLESEDNTQLGAEEEQEGADADH
jgi:large subunit ribosomal protein L4